MQTFPRRGYSYALLSWGQVVCGWIQMSGLNRTCRLNSRFPGKSMRVEGSPNPQFFKSIRGLKWTFCGLPESPCGMQTLPDFHQKMIHKPQKYACDKVKKNNNDNNMYMNMWRHLLFVFLLYYVVSLLMKISLIMHTRNMHKLNSLVYILEYFGLFWFACSKFASSTCKMYSSSFYV